MAHPPLKDNGNESELDRFALGKFHLRTTSLTQRSSLQRLYLRLKRTLEGCTLPSGFTLSFSVVLIVGSVSLFL